MRKARLALLVLAATTLGLAVSGGTVFAAQVGPGGNAPAVQVGPGG